MLADGVDTKDYTITIRGVSDTIDVTTTFTLKISNPCGDPATSSITQPAALNPTHEVTYYIGHDQIAHVSWESEFSPSEPLCGSISFTLYETLSSGS